MFRSAVAAAVFLASASSAMAWKAQVSEDPLTDKKTSYMYEPQREGGLNPYSLGVKCWEEQYGSTILVVQTPMRFDQAADYKDEIDVIVRVDKNEKVVLKLQPRDIGGRLSLGIDIENEPELGGILKQMGQAKDRIAVGLGSQILTFSAKGLQKSTADLAKACGITF